MCLLRRLRQGEISIEEAAAQRGQESRMEPAAGAKAAVRAEPVRQAGTPVRGEVREDLWGDLQEEPREDFRGDLRTEAQSAPADVPVKEAAEPDRAGVPPQPHPAAGRREGIRRRHPGRCGSGRYWRSFWLDYARQYC